jgi:hypothetical protein
MHRSTYDLLLVGGVEVDVVGADTGGDAQLELLCLLDDGSGRVAGVEGGAASRVSVLRMAGT